MLTPEEALVIAAELDIWPGGWGFMLRPSTRSKRGFAATGFHPSALPCKVERSERL